MTRTEGDIKRALRLFGDTPQTRRAIEITLQELAKQKKGQGR